MNIAGEVIPFGRAIKRVGDVWMLSGIDDMQGAAGRPAWANRTRGDTRLRTPEHFAPGDVIDPLITDGALLMVFADKHSSRAGIVTLPGESEYVTIKGGRLCE